MSIIFYVLFAIIACQFIRCAWRVTIRTAVRKEPATFGEIYTEMMLPISRPALRLLDKVLDASSRPKP